MTAVAIDLDLDLPRLVELLTRQRDLYRHLHQLSASQSPLVDAGSAEQLLDVLAQRQRLIDELAAVNEELGPYRQNWARVWPRVPDEERGGLSELLKDVDTLLQNILKQDERDRMKLQQSRDRVGAELSKVKHTSAAVRAYGGRPATSTAAAPRLTDRQA